MVEKARFFLKDKTKGWYGNCNINIYENNNNNSLERVWHPHGPLMSSHGAAIWSAL